MNVNPPSFKPDWSCDLIERPTINESLAHHYIGKTILIGVTYENSKGEVLGQHQWAGKIKTFSNDLGIQVELFGSDEFCALPPDVQTFESAKPGTYSLKSTGQVLVNPDYLVKLTCTKSNEEE